MIQKLHWTALLLLLGACATGTDVKTSLKSGPMVDQKQHGLWNYYYENGNLRAKGNYDKDRQIGRWSYWYEDGPKEWDVGFSTEQFDGPSQWWWPSGGSHAYGVFTKGLESGPFSYWNEQGSLVMQGEFDDGLGTLNWMSWYDDAKPKARGMMWKGMRVGQWEFWGEDGTAYAHTFAPAPGVKPQRETWEDGTPRREGYLASGRPTGRWSTHHENGVRRASGRIVDGKPHGFWTLYRPDGTLLASIKYDHGNPAPAFKSYVGMTPTVVPSGAVRIRAVEGSFSPSDAAADRPVAEVVSTWISEVLSPPAQDIEPEIGAAPEPPEDLQAELSRKAVLPLHSQPWTDSEEKNMNYLVQLYTDGAPSAAAPPGGGQYGGRPRAAGGPRSVKRVVSEGDVKRSSPLIGRKLGTVQPHTRDGGTIDLHSLQGKPLVLVILRGMSGEICVYCYTQVRALSKAMPEFEAEGANVVVVYPGDADRLEVFWKELSKSEELEGRDAPFTFAYDPDFELVRSLSIEGNLALPTTLVIDGEGTIRFAYVGADSADRPDAKRLLEQVKGLRAK